MRPVTEARAKLRRKYERGLSIEDFFNKNNEIMSQSTLADVLSYVESEIDNEVKVALDESQGG